MHCDNKMSIVAISITGIDTEAAHLDKEVKRKGALRKDAVTALLLKIIKAR